MVVKCAFLLTLNTLNVMLLFVINGQQVLAMSVQQAITKFKGSVSTPKVEKEEKINLQ